MIRLPDATILAYTKLRTHKVRTGLSVGVAGLLFGMIVAVIMVLQGVFSSIDRFGEQSLASRTFMTVNHTDFNAYDRSALSGDEAFIREVQALHAADVAKRSAAAKKHGVSYNPATDTPAPAITKDDDGTRYISDSSIDSDYVVQALAKRQAAAKDPFDVAKYISGYSSATVLKDYWAIGGDSQITLSPAVATGDEEQTTAPAFAPNESTNVMVIDSQVTKPFVSDTTFDPAKGEVPVIIPYAKALSLLDITPVDKKASSEAKLAQLREVRQRVSEISVGFCYRNQASQQLVQQAKDQAAEVKRMTTVDGYQPPALQYAVPADDSCAPVTVQRDNRTAAEKQAQAALTAYQKEVGDDAGEPVQYAVTLRGVGIVGDPGDGSLSSVAGMVQSLVGSNLGYGTWAIPSDLLAQLPAEARPAAIFSESAAQAADDFMGRTYLVEFTDPSQARQLLDRANQQYYAEDVTGDTVIVSQFGSNSILIDEMKQWLNQALFWALIFVGSVAVIIMTSMIGRTVADGRRESAVFRAIGAKRSDIAAVYGVYALLLSLRAAAFALLLGAIIALIIDGVYGQDATIGAHLAYASVDPATTFRLFGIWTIHLPIIIVAMIIAGLLASIIPIARSARRNPINDMRDDT